MLRNWNEVKSGQTYVVEFIHSERDERFMRARKIDEPRSEHALLESGPLEGSEMLKSILAGRIRAVDGRQIVFGGHGEWYTRAEADYIWDLEGGRPVGKAPWIGGRMPLLNRGQRT